MKILHALGWYFPEALGGTEIYVRSLAQRQRVFGHHVEIAAPLAGLTRAEHSQQDDIPILRYPSPLAPTREETQGRAPARGSEFLRDYLKKMGPDVLHVHTFTTGLGVFELEAARELKIRIVATNHLGSVGFLCQRGTFMRWGERLCDGLVTRMKCAACELQKSGLSKAAAWAVAGVGHWTGAAGANISGRVGTALGMPDLISHNLDRQRRTLECVDRFVLLNRAARDIVVLNGGAANKLELNYLGVSHGNSIHKPSPVEQPTELPVTIGFVGRFVTIKGVLDLARAVAALPSELDFRLELRAVIDDGARRLREKFDAIVGDDSRVELAPAVPPESVPEVLAGYDVLCVPSIWFENGPTVVSEAFAVGTPVIGTRIGAMPELIDDGVNGALVDPGDWRALASILGNVAASPETIDAWRVALPTARTMDEITSDYESLYRQIQTEAVKASGDAADAGV